MNFSLDFWNTIAQPNTEFSYQRNSLIAQSLDIPLKTAKEVYTNTKWQLDQVAETYGIGKSVKDSYRSLAIAFAHKLPNRSSIEVCNIVVGLERHIIDLFLKYPPHINSELKSTIRELRSHKVHRFCITSNTNFISGLIIEKFLQNIDFTNCFDFYLFSDHVGCSKPNPEIFDLVKLAFKNSDSIIHIGDHPVCDNPGEIFEHRIINNTSELPKILKELSK